MIKDIVNANEKVTLNGKEMSVLRENFPACFKADGSFDIERFKEYLSDKLTISNEGYELKFLGKNYARLLASVDTTTVIVPDEEHNNKPENKNSENIYISGDNLDGLKQLLKSYANKVKCIYIDPPYNTGSDGFVYNDDFNFTVEELSTKLSIDEEQAQRILDLTKRGSASHSAWLMFMYPRLLLARDLLKNDGVIFISIDDNEQSNLKLLCDDVFGEENFVCKFDWRKKTGANDAKDIAVITESILCYSKNKSASILNMVWNRDEKSVNKSRYNLSDEYVETRGKYYLDTLDRGGLQYSDSMNYPIEAPDGGVIYPNGRDTFINDGWIWKWGKEKVEWGIKKKFLEFVKSDKSKGSMYTIKYKVYENVDNEGNVRKVKGRAFSNLIIDPINQIGKIEIKSLFNSDNAVFSNPKPVGLIDYLLNTIDIDNEIVVDFFGGSSTTAHCILKNNVLNGNTTFITIQIKENIKDNPEATRLGFNTIDQIGMERIILTAKKIKEEYPNTTADLGFKHFTLEEPKENTLDKLENFVPEDQGMFVNNDILSDFGTQTVLTTWLVRDGYGFNADVKAIDFNGYNGYYIDKHLYLIDPDITTEAIAAIVDKYETDGSFNAENIVLFGYSFVWTKTEELKMNLARLKDTEKNLRINFDVRY